MVSSAILKRTSNAFKIDERVEKIPNASPVVEVGKSIINVILTGLADNATSGTILTTPTDTRSFYIVGYCLSVRKDAGATSVWSGITCVVDSNTVNLTRIRYNGAGTAQTTMGNVPFTFYSPIKVDKGTVIAVVNNTNNANITAEAIIYGYYEED